MIIYHHLIGKAKIGVTEWLHLTGTIVCTLINVYNMRSLNFVERKYTEVVEKPKIFTLKIPKVSQNLCNYYSGRKDINRIKYIRSN